MRRCTLFLFAATGAIAACTDGTAPSESDHQPAQAPAAAIGTDYPRGIGQPDRVSWDIAKQLPGFGGLYWDDAGNLHVFLTDLSLADRAKQAFATKLASRRPGMITRPSGPRSVIIHQGRYDVRQLIQWRRLARDVALTVPGTYSVGVSGSTNTIAVGVETPAAGSALLAAMAAAGLPPDAVTVIIGAGPKRTESLSSQPDTIEGGFRVEHFLMRNTYYYTGQCTLGLIGILDQVSVIATASHCTADHHGVEGTELYQPFTYDGRKIGDEYIDPPWEDYRSNGDCPFEPSGNPRSNGQPMYCRYSDVALYTFAPGVIGWIGRMARTEFYREGAGLVGSTTIDSNFPYFRITGRQDYVDIGDPVHKIGATTGWTMGRVYLTCRDIWPSNPEENWYVFCANEVANAGDEAGDSGAPAFILPGVPGPGDAEIVGITFAKSNSGFYYSPMANIDMEIGYLNF